MILHIADIRFTYLPAADPQVASSHSSALVVRQRWISHFAGQLTGRTRSGKSRMWCFKLPSSLFLNDVAASEIETMIDRMSEYQPIRTLNRMRGKQLEGTTEWLTLLDEFTQWRSMANAVQSLHLCGKGGSSSHRASDLLGLS